MDFGISSHGDVHALMAEIGGLNLPQEPDDLLFAESALLRVRHSPGG